MIYGFIKTNNKYISKDEQEKAIKQFASAKGFLIDRYLIDDYEHNYCEIYNLKQGYGTGTYVFNLNPGDIFVCSHFYTLAYSYKTVMFLIKTALERGAKIYSVDENTELNETDLNAFKILYDLHCLFDRLRNEKTLRRFWKTKLESFRDQIGKDVQNGISIKEMTKKYHVVPTTVRKFLYDNPELAEIYKETNPLFGRQSRMKKWLEKRPFWKKQINRYVRKAKANIVPTHTLQLANKLDTSQNSTSTENSEIKKN